MKLVFRISVFFVACAAFAQPPTRLSWQEFSKDPNRVQALRNAVAVMKSRNSADRKSVEYRKSWEYWGSMHGYFGKTATAKTVAEWRVENSLTGPQYDAAFAGIMDNEPPDDIAKTVWDQCQHRTDFFFVWHRLFLYYFERVLQDAAGDPSLRLPYWDYTDPDYLAMPAEFRSPTYITDGRKVDNPLFEQRRDPRWEAGTIALEQENTDVDLVLDKRDFFSKTVNGEVEPGFQASIENIPHGYVHCTVTDCKVTVMGAVPYSSNDPIFWIHHANIDRLFECWMNEGNKPPQSVMGQQYPYIDENGKLVKKYVRNLFDGSLIDYVYQQPSGCRRKEAPPPGAYEAPAATVNRARAALTGSVMIGEAKSHAITAPVTQKRVTLPATASVSHPRQFALREQDQLPVATELVLRKIHFAEHPLANFRIYLQRADDPKHRVYVATLTFFAEEPEGSGHHPQPEDTRVFDATDELRELDFEGTGTFGVDVVFEAAGRGDFNAERTKMVIEEIELRVKRDR